MRRILIIIAAIVLLIAIGVGIYFWIFASKGGITAKSGVSQFPSSGAVSTGTTGSGPSAQELGVPLPGAGTDIAPKLVRITDRPVALGGVATYVPAKKPSTATSTASGTPISAYNPDVRVEYIERESGNVYAYMAHARTLTRLSNKTLPGITKASWLSDGSQAYAQFIQATDNDEHVATYALPANGEGGYFLEQDLTQILTKGTSTLVTLLSTTDGSSATVSTPSGAGLRTLFTTALSSIRLAFMGSNYLVTTKASSQMDGYAFMVDGKSGAFTRVLGPLQSLTTLPSPSGTLVLYSYLDRGKVALAVLDTSTHAATRLPLATLPEKCAWTTDSKTLYCGVPTTALGAQEPDNWYQGVSSFSDRLWKIDLASRVATLVVDPKQAGNTDIDMVGLSLDQTNDVLIFSNKRDGTLYAYDL